MSCLEAEDIARLYPEVGKLFASIAVMPESMRRDPAVRQEYLDLAQALVGPRRMVEEYETLGGVLRSSGKPDTRQACANVAGKIEMSKALFGPGGDACVARWASSSLTTVLARIEEAFSGTIPTGGAD